MRYLLDTAALLGWWSNTQRLPAVARDTISDRANELWVSAASAWEMATKIRIGKLSLPNGRIEDYEDYVTGEGFEHLPVRPAHALRGGLLVSKHKDPFDRLIGAQALEENLTVISPDRAFAAFGCKTLW